MPSRKNKSGFYLLAVPLRPLLGTITVTLLITLALSLIILSKLDNPLARNLRASITAVTVPVLDVMSRPFDAASNAGNWFGEVINMRAENVRLKAQNAELMRWQLVAREMEAENKSLHKLLNFTAQQGFTYSSARIVTDSAGPFARTALINAGSDDGIEQYHPVISDRGLVGRIVEVGSDNARVLLITDINSRIPVMTENSREKSVLAGSNSDMPMLTYLPDDTKVQIGERVVTAGDGGLLPAGLPVGVVQSIDDNVVKVLPLVDWSRLELVSIVHHKF